MTDVVTALQDATAELHNAAVLYQTKAKEVSDKLPLFQNSAQTIINNFLNRAPAVSAWVDGNIGVDAAGRGGETTPFKTLDYAMDSLDSSVTNVIYCLTDITLTKYRPLFNKVNLVGFARVPSGPYGFPYTYTNRKLSFASEAYNSPRSDFGRVPAFFDMQGGTLSFTYIDITLPLLPAGVLSNGFPYLIAPGGYPVSFVGSVISAEASSGCAKLFAFSSWITQIFFNTVTIGNNAKGQIFSGVAAGQDPNVVTDNFRSNLKSA